MSPFDLVMGEKNVAGSCAGVGNDWTDAIALLQYGRVDPSPLFSMVVPLEELEKEHILATLKFTNQHRKNAADLLGISRKTLKRKLDSWGKNFTAGHY